MWYCSYAGAFDLDRTSNTTFAPVVFFNDTFGIPDNGEDVGTNYMREPQLLNMAVNGWLKAVLGECGFGGHLCLSLGHTWAHNWLGYRAVAMLLGRANCVAAMHHTNPGKGVKHL